jgi:hypothetical protein
MHCSKKFRALPWCIVLATSVFLGGFSPEAKPSQQTRGDVVSGLQLTVYLDQEKVASKNPKFMVELRNAGEDDLVLNLGFMLANGRKQYPDAIVLTLRDAHGKSWPFHLREPFTINGRVDPFVLPLPVGAIFSIPVDFNKYFAMPGPLQPGTYSLEAQFRGKSVSQEEAKLDVRGVALTPYWNDTVTSNLLRFEIPNQ